jgi:hypothetical protein
VSLCLQGAWLSWEAQEVIVLRLARLAAGGPKAQAEASRMVMEKLAAFADGQVMMLGATLRGEPEVGAESLLGMYRRRVRANRLRLSRG